MAHIMERSEYLFIIPLQCTWWRRHTSLSAGILKYGFRKQQEETTASAGEWMECNGTEKGRSPPASTDDGFPFNKGKAAAVRFVSEMETHRIASPAPSRLDQEQVEQRQACVRVADSGVWHDARTRIPVSSRHTHRGIAVLGREPSEWRFQT
jgi:hypothetical protein